MKNIILLFIVCISVVGSAQNTISGTFSPAEEYTWLIAYRLKPGTQVYVADTEIDKGTFNLKLPENAEKGTYRLVYAIPQEQFYFDVIYNGIEDIKLAFEIGEGVVFSTSEENILFGTYFNEIATVAQEIVGYYSAGSEKIKEHEKLFKKYQEVQDLYEEKSTNLIANQFIKANQPYIPSAYESIEEYVRNKKLHYFKNLDVNNPILQASAFLTDKLTNYVFTALPLKTLEKKDTEKEIQANIETVANHIKDLNDSYSFQVLYTIWNQSSAMGYNETADFVFENYLKTATAASSNTAIIKKIEIDSRLRINAVAPELIWSTANKEKKLSALSGYKNYVLVFWSSTCGHCLKELPALHKQLKDNKDIKVIAVGLEEDKISWSNESKKLASFEHAISLGKWDSEYAALYDIQSTPSYFILDDQKRIIAKPDSDKDVVTFFEAN